MFSKAASPQCAATKVSSVFVQFLFSFLGQPTFEKSQRPGGDTASAESSQCDDMDTFWSHSRERFSNKSVKKGSSRITCFLRDGRNARPGAIATSAWSGMSGHAGPMEPSGKEN